MLGARIPAAGWLAGGLALLTLTAAVVVLWLTREALRNEQLAARQMQDEAGMLQLGRAQRLLAMVLAELTSPLNRSAGAPAARFLGLVGSSDADGAVIFGADLQPLYPALADTDEPPVLQSERWAIARSAEEAGDFLKAAAAAAEITTEQGLSTSEELLARQAQVRSLLHAGRTAEAEQAAMIYSRTESAVELRIHARTLLLVAEADRGAHRAREALREMSGDYRLPLSSAVRRMIARHLASAGERMLPEMEWEHLSSAALHAGLSTAPPPGLRESPLPGVWSFTAADRTATLLYREPSLTVLLSRMLEEPSVVLAAPGAPAPPRAAVSLPAGPELPGWMLYDQGPPEPEPESRAARYAWIGGLSVLALAGLTLFTGLSVRRQMQRARLREDLAASVSHELRTPLASMRLLVDSLLEDDPPDEARTRDYLQLLAQENMRLSRMVENFLTLSRVERSRNPLERQLIAPAEIAERTLASAAGTSAGPRIRHEIAPDLPLISVPADALITALLNLLDNAAKYSPPDQPITFSVRAEGEQVCFAVTDRGQGLTKAQIAEIWQPFVRQNADAATPGCGLGLCIVRAIASQCGGEARVRSSPGAGCTFSLLIPRH